MAGKSIVVPGKLIPFLLVTGPPSSTRQSTNEPLSPPVLTTDNRIKPSAIKTESPGLSSEDKPSYSTGSSSPSCSFLPHRNLMLSPLFRSLTPLNSPSRNLGPGKSAKMHVLRVSVSIERILSYNSVFCSGSP